MDQRGSNYADRPLLWVRELFDDSRIIMRGYDDLWRTERKLYHSQLNITVAKKYLPYQASDDWSLSITDMMPTIFLGARDSADAHPDRQRSDKLR